MRKWENVPTQIVCFSATNGGGKTTQAGLLARALAGRNIAAKTVDTFLDIIYPEIYPETLPDKTYEVELKTQVGAIPFTTTRNRERELNLAGKLNTPKWVAWLVCRAICETVMADEWPIFSGSPRSQLEAEEFAAELGSTECAYGKTIALIVIEIRFPDLEIVRKRIIKDVMTIPDEQERARRMYKIDEFERRASTYKDETVPAFDWLMRYAPVALRKLTITDDGSRSAAEIHEEIMINLERTLAVE